MHSILVFVLAICGFFLTLAIPSSAPLNFGILLIVMAFYWLHVPSDNRAIPTHRPSAKLPIPFSDEQLADYLPNALFLLNECNHISFLNKAAREYFPTISPTQNFTSHFRAPELIKAIQKCRQDGKNVSVNYQEKRQAERFFIAYLALFPNQNVLCLLQDHTHTYHVEKMRSDFVANASHELRTPLASLSGFIETLRGTAKHDEETREKFLSIMQDQALRMGKLIDDLLSLSRLEMRHSLLNPVALNVHDILQQVCDSLTPLATSLSVEITLTESPTPLPPLLAVSDDLIQLFQNLIENACKYGRSGGKVSIKSQSDAYGITVTIQDYGIGIAREHIPRLTERFYRVDTSQKHHKGTGLGLSIVKHILNLYNGKLTIYSRLNEGSQFNVFLPYH
ncbi:ATP-binding protein [Bartonella sp. DGB2]|uniref:ATP-binding protein n=1 Tax=Bartonella sp. DGB2 TaxID=3388426 RepID=UPI003990241F